MTINCPKLLKKSAGFTLIELLVVIGILAILLSIVLIAINPARQFGQANDTKRTSAVTQILNAVGAYAADNKGLLPAGIPTGVVGTDDIEISKNAAGTGADLCSLLVPNYMPALPTDPSLNTDDVASPCPATYSTGYHIVKDTTGRVTVIAPNAEITTPIKITR
jgi:type IV pilus assembly protein PilA